MLLLLPLLLNRLAARKGPWLVSGVAVNSRRNMGVLSTTPVCCSTATVVLSGSKPWSAGSRNDTCTAGVAHNKANKMLLNTGADWAQTHTVHSIKQQMCGDG
jgi:hypothetical protein